MSDTKVGRITFGPDKPGSVFRKIAEGPVTPNKDTRGIIWNVSLSFTCVGDSTKSRYDLQDELEEKIRAISNVISVDLHSKNIEFDDISNSMNFSKEEIAALKNQLL